MKKYVNRFWILVILLFGTFQIYAQEKQKILNDFLRGKIAGLICKEGVWKQKGGILYSGAEVELDIDSTKVDPEHDGRIIFTGMGRVKLSNSSYKITLYTKPPIAIIYKFNPDEVVE